MFYVCNSYTMGTRDSYIGLKCPSPEGTARGLGHFVLVYPIVTKV